MSASASTHTNPRARRARRGFTIIEAIASIVLLGMVVSAIGMMNIYVAQRTRAEARITARNAVFIQQAGWLTAIPYDTLDKIYPVPTVGSTQTWETVITAQSFSYRRILTLTNGDENAPAPIRRRTVTLRIIPAKSDGTADTSTVKPAVAQFDRWKTINPLNNQ